MWSKFPTMYQLNISKNRDFALEERRFNPERSIRTLEGWKGRSDFLLAPSTWSVDISSGRSTPSVRAQTSLNTTGPDSSLVIRFNFNVNQ